MDKLNEAIPLLGGTVKVELYDVEEPMASDCLNLIREEGTRLQKIFDFYNPSSELSLLNKRRKAAVSDEMAEVISKALKYSFETEGLYDISIGKRVLARKQGKPLPESSCSYRDIAVDKNKVSLNHPDVLVDLGSIAKGYIGDKIVEYMKSLGIESGFVDARGDIRTFGNRKELVAVQHPRARNVTLSPIILQNLSVATSGDYVQYDGTHDKCHIIGSRDFASVTIVAEKLADADALATCVFLLGSGLSGEFLSAHKEVKAYAIDKSLNEYLYNGFRSLTTGGVGHGA